MRKPGSDPDNLSMSDFLCDFCGQYWTDVRPMVEGHEGSLICSECLKVAHVEVLVAKASSLGPGAKCVLCLEERKDANWQSPMFEQAVACARCIRQASTALAQDPDSGWSRPAPTDPE